MSSPSSYDGTTKTSKCTSGPQPGTIGLYRQILNMARFDKLTGLGVFHCRTVRNGSSLSKHGQGRALDIGFVPSGDALRQADDLVETLTRSSGLGVQSVVYRRRSWRIGRGWINVPKNVLHDDHAHIEQNWYGAKESSSADIATVFGGPILEVRTMLQAGDTGATAKLLIDQLRFIGYPTSNSSTIGPVDVQAVVGFQTACRAGVEGVIAADPVMQIDGIVGPQTWAKLETVTAFIEGVVSGWYDDVLARPPSVDSAVFWAGRIWVYGLTATHGTFLRQAETELQPPTPPTPPEPPTPPDAAGPLTAAEIRAVMDAAATSLIESLEP